MSLCINPQCEQAIQRTDQGQDRYCSECRSPLSLNHIYRVIRYLGKGGFAQTALVADKNGKEWVLKFLHNTDPHIIELFDQEAKVLQELCHSGIPRVAAGKEGRFDYHHNGSPTPLHCLVMEYIEGDNLLDYMEKFQYQPIPEELAVDWLQQLVEILDVVHKANYFHRDIKPNNIMLNSEDKLVLIDFGAAREETETYLQKMQGGQTLTGLMTKGYTPNEQQQGRAEYRSDFFALGRTFVFLLTGQQPNHFEESLTKGLIWHEKARNYSKELRNFIDDLMAPDVEKRPRDTQAILKRLNTLKEQNLSASQDNTIPLLIGQKMSPKEGKQLVIPLPSEWAKISRRKLIVGGGVAVGVVGVTGLGLLIKNTKLSFPTLSRNYTETLPGGVKLDMIAIPAGEFLMGSPNNDSDAENDEKPQRQVKLASFLLGKYPVTQAQWHAVMGHNPSNHTNNPENPVELVSWYDAQDFCRKLSLLTKKIYRLPSESEWEYAYRAGTVTRYFFGEDASRLGEYAWYQDNSNDQTHPCGQKKSNDWGLYDMAGNVWEVCEDNYHDSYNNAPKDGSAWNYNQYQSSSRISRGGSYFSEPRFLRSTQRSPAPRDKRYVDSGFRVALSL